MLNQRLDNLSAEFKLGSRPNDDVWKHVGDHIMDNAKSPIELFLEPREKVENHAIRLDLHVSNPTNVMIRGAALHFVTPPLVSVGHDGSMPPPFVGWRGGRGFMFHQNLPSPLALRERIRVPSSIQISSLRADLAVLADLPISTIAQQWVLNLPSVWHDVSIAVAVQAPGFESSVYELFVINEGEKWRRARLQERRPPDKALVSINVPGPSEPARYPA